MFLAALAALYLTLVSEWLTDSLSATVPNLKGDQKYSERGPDFEQKGDLKGTKKGTQNSRCSENQKEITSWNFKDIESRWRKICLFFAFI